MIAVAVVTAIPSFAVTDKEMEQARVLAAKHYLRYANNGSDYLDKLNPSTLSELSGSLKTKEKENIKSFNAVAVPKDYASWDKAKLVEYWSSTFFKSPGLKEDGKKCLSVLVKNLQKMEVAAPSAAAPSAPAAAPAEKPAEKPADAQPAAAAQNDAANAAEVEQEIEQTEAAIAQAEADAGLVEEKPRESSNTTLYIIILAVLVIGVIWLVVYASKSMKETGANLSDRKASEKEIRETKRAAKEELNKMRDQYADSLTSKNDEIKQLKAQCESLEAELEAARRETAAVRRELDSARREQSGTQARRPEPSPRPAQTSTQQAPAQEKPQPAPARQGGLPPMVYLSLVNQKGLFVKASRSLNAESSVYVMDIPDGHHGEFRVVNDQKVLDRILEDVDKWLAGGCIMENPEDADIATEIVTLQAGEAVFADNTCRVTKKARIKFI